MLPLPPFRLHSPDTVADAVALLAALGEDARVVAGGTDLLPNMKQGLVSPRHLVSVERIEALRHVGVEDGVLVLGAGVTLHALETSGTVRELAPGLAEAAAAVGGPHHRRMGTLGGNVCLDTRCRYVNQSRFWRGALGGCLKKEGLVCHVVPGGQRCVAAASNDTAAALVALSATLVLVGPRGPRVVRVADFYTANGIANTVRAQDELLVRVEIPIVRGRRSAYEKLRARGAIDFPQLSVAASVDVEDGLVTRLELVVSALASRPRAVGAAHLAIGKAEASTPVDEIASGALRECHPLANIDGDVEWRRRMVPVLARRALCRLGLGPGTALSR